MVWYRVYIHSFFMEISSFFLLFPAPFIEQTATTDHKINWPQMSGFISRLSILFHCSMLVFMLVPPDPILIIIALEYILKPGSMISLAFSCFVFCSRLLWLLKVFCYSIQIWGLFSLFLGEKTIRIHLGYIFILILILLIHDHQISFHSLRHL